MKLLVIVLFLSTSVCIATDILHEVTHSRMKRQDAGDLFIDSVFQIPIQTLSAVNTLVKTSRPIVMQIRNRFQQTHGLNGVFGSGTPQNNNNRVGFVQTAAQQLFQQQFNSRRTQGAKVARVKAARDGSGFRI